MATGSGMPATAIAAPAIASGCVAPTRKPRQRLPPEPRLQTNPRQDLSDLRAREDQLLNSYGWVDKNTGVVRIPIERAMQLIVERGLPTRSESGPRR